MFFGQILETLGGKQRKFKIDQGLRTLDNLCQLFTELLNEYGTQLKAIEHEMIDHFGYLEPEGQKALTVTRRLLQAVNQRLKKINSYTVFDSVKSLELATELAESPIALESDRLSQLSTELPVPPVPLRELRTKLDELFAQMTIVRRQQLF